MIEVTIPRLREIIERYDEDTSCRVMMWYDSMINTVVFARLTAYPLDAQIFHMQDSAQELEAIEKIAQGYYENSGESEDSAILNAIFAVAEMVRDT